MDTKGGRFTISINGRGYSGRGQAKLMPSRVSVKTGANSDGTGYTTIEAKLAGLDLSFDRGIGMVWGTVLMVQTLDVTFLETDAGIQHYFTAANWDGDPTIDSATGEVTGLKIMTDKYSNSND